MAIFARELTARTYRNFSHASLALDEAVTVLVGRNAAGKTNLVEALQLLTSGMSFRRPSPAELVREHAESCTARLRLEGDGRVIDLGFTVEKGRRSFSRNGKRCHAAGVRGVVPSVLFCPDDLDMIKRSASRRRRALDSFGVQLNERYAKLASSYEHIVEQRNTLLKEPYLSQEMLAPWDEALARCGAALMSHRTALLDRVSAHLAEAYGHIAPGERVGVAYEPTIGEVKPGEGISELQERFCASLSGCAADERRRGLTLVGPHRDEVRFTIDGRDARLFASQGQQRSLVLAWKIAEVEVTRDILGRPPLLLLDDVMSELDALRRAAFMETISQGVQTVITTTNLGYFSPQMLDQAKVVEIDGTGELG